MDVKIWELIKAGGSTALERVPAITRPHGFCQLTGGLWSQEARRNRDNGRPVSGLFAAALCFNNLIKNIYISAVVKEIFALRKQEELIEASN